LENGKIIFAGNEKKIQKFRKKTWKYIIAMTLSVSPFLIWISYDIISGKEPLFSRNVLILSLGGFAAYYTFLSFALLPQNFEIREDGILLPLRRWRDVVRRKERFIEYGDISDIKLGETVVEHELILKNGKRISLGVWGGFFLLYGIAMNRVGKLDRTLRAIREELIRQKDKDRKIIIRKEGIDV